MPGSSRPSGEWCDSVRPDHGPTLRAPGQPATATTLRGALTAVGHYAPPVVVAMATVVKIVLTDAKNRAFGIMPVAGVSVA